MERGVQLLGEVAEEKVWAATWLLTRGREWASIDMIGDFLRMRQTDAAREEYREDSVHTRYALPRKVTKWPKGWEDSIIAHALSDCVDHRTVEHRQTDGVNYFRAKPAKAHGLWTYKSTDAPVPATNFQHPFPQFRT